jgi:DNA-cytosine methyltransferase
MADVNGHDNSYPAMISRLLPKEAPPRVGMRLASFFCCAGGIDLGFRSAGFELAFANDISDKAAETFGRNLGHKPIVRDIRGVGPADYPPEPVDVVTGGFPCVTFSMAGQRAGIVDDINGKLYLELCRVITELKPRYFVAENVKGMLSSNGGRDVKLVLAAFLRLGYRTQYQLVNMAEHGVPQTRERVIFVGVRLDEWRGSFVFPKPTHKLADDKRAPAWLRPAVTLRQAIGDLPAPGEKLHGMIHGDSAETKPGRSGVSTFQNSKPRGADRPSHSVVASMAGVLIVSNDHERNKYDDSRSGAMSSRVARSGRPSPTVLSGGFVPGNNSPLIVMHTNDDSLMAARNDDFHNPFVSADRPSPTIVSSEAPQMMHRHPEVVGNLAGDAARRSKRAAKAEPPALYLAGGSSHERNDYAPRKMNMARRVAKGGKPSPTVVSGGHVPGSDAPFIRDHERNDAPVVPTYSTSKRVARSGKPSPTMVSQAGGGSQNAHPLVDRMRRMTVRECARVQSFPDWYEFARSQADGYRVVGNAVPPLYARRLAEAIIAYDGRPIVR